jgi:hypothetical protein
MDLLLTREKVDRPNLRQVSIPDILNARRASASARVLMGNLGASHSISPDFPHFPPNSVSNSAGNPASDGESAGDEERT